VKGLGSSGVNIAGLGGAGVNTAGLGGSGVNTADLGGSGVNGASGGDSTEIPAGGSLNLAGPILSGGPSLVGGIPAGCQKTPSPPTISPGLNCMIDPCGQQPALSNGQQTALSPLILTPALSSVHSSGQPPFSALASGLIAPPACTPTPPGITSQTIPSAPTLIPGQHSPSPGSPDALNTTMLPGQPNALNTTLYPGQHTPPPALNVDLDSQLNSGQPPFSGTSRISELDRIRGLDPFDHCDLDHLERHLGSVSTEV